MNVEEVIYGEESIRFTLERRNRKTLGINVYPDGSVRVVAPLSSSREDVFAVVQRRGRWILQQQEHFASIAAPTIRREYVSGEAYRYLGRQYLLKVVEVETKGEEGVRLVSQTILVHVLNNRKRNRTERLVTGWYREHARATFTERLGTCSDVMRKYGIARPILRLQVMPTRWGSCTKEGVIILNPELVQMPVYCIDYVITHELCHLNVMRHDKEFTQLLGRAMPDWRERKKRLERLACR